MGRLRHICMVAMVLTFLPAGSAGSTTETPGITEFAQPPGVGKSFGSAVATDGVRVVVGAYEDGAAYIYKPDGSGGWSRTKVMPALPAGRFGYSVAVSRDLVVVGAPFDDPQNAGAVYVFEPDGRGGWASTRLTAADAAPGDALGWAVSTSIDRIVAGAPSDSVGPVECGSAYVFTRRDSGWDQTRLVPSDCAQSDQFGTAVAISGDRIVVGAPKNDDRGGATGSAYVFDIDGAGGWTQTKLVASDGASGDFFGAAVAVSDDLVAVGAFGSHPGSFNTGAAYVYRRSLERWEETKLTAPDAAVSDWFGWSVAVEADLIAIGAPADDDLGPSSGSVYVYEADGKGGWTVSAKISPSGGTAGDRFGRAVSVSGGLIAVGTSDRISSSAYLIDGLAGWSCGGRPATIVGSWAGDVLVGTEGPDVIVGLGGPDTIDGLGGDDVICGGDGNDRILGGDGNDVIYGEAGRDRVWAGPGHDTLWGGQHRDLLNGQTGDDTLWGELGDDILHGRAGDDVLYGGDGVDRMWGAKGSDTLWGHDGDDLLKAGPGDDTIWGGAGDDTICGQAGADSIYGEDGDDLIVAGTGADRVWGGPGGDTIEGRAHPDILWGEEGADSLFGGTWPDVLDGGNGTDALDGGDGIDTCTTGEVLSGCEQ